MSTTSSKLLVGSSGSANPFKPENTDFEQVKKREIHSESVKEKKKKAGNRLTTADKSSPTTQLIKFDIPACKHKDCHFQELFIITRGFELLQRETVLRWQVINELPTRTRGQKRAAENQLLELYDINKFQTTIQHQYQAWNEKMDSYPIEVPRLGYTIQRTHAARVGLPPYLHRQTHRLPKHRQDPRYLDIEKRVPPQWLPNCWQPLTVPRFKNPETQSMQKELHLKTLLEHIMGPDLALKGGPSRM